MYIYHYFFYDFFLRALQYSKFSQLDLNHFYSQVSKTSSSSILTYLELLINPIRYNQSRLLLSLDMIVPLNIQILDYIVCVVTELIQKKKKEISLQRSN